MTINIQVIIETFLIVLQVVPRTLLLASFILVMGILLGLVFAVVQIKKVPVISQLITLFISYVRGVPLIVHLLVVRYSLPGFTASFLSIFGVAADPNEFPNLIIVLVTYSLLEAAIETLNIKGAYQSLDPAQIEAGMSIGFTRKQNFTRIIVPQTISTALPLFLNALLKIIKALSLAFTVGVVEILAQARYAAALNFRYLESYIAAALVYWAVCGILQTIFTRIEEKYQLG